MKPRNDVLVTDFTDFSSPFGNSKGIAVAGMDQSVGQHGFSSIENGVCDLKILDPFKE
jgi:hypothetical protein